MKLRKEHAHWLDNIAFFFEKPYFKDQYSSHYLKIADNLGENLEVAENDESDSAVISAKRQVEITSETAQSVYVEFYQRPLHYRNYNSACGNFINAYIAWQQFITPEDDAYYKIPAGGKIEFTLDFMQQFATLDGEPILDFDADQKETVDHLLEMGKICRENEDWSIVVYSQNAPVEITEVSY